jgi:predicted DCC family thiol-disulfide oxidoreductase YuxK
MQDIPEFPLQIFYDGACSVCAKEMDIYRRKGHGGRLEFVDISAAQFDAARFGISLDAFMREMHAIDRRGRVYRGVEAFRAIWQAFPGSTGYRVLATLIALPGVNLLARIAYRVFARIRKYLPKKYGNCEDGVCRRRQDIPPP